MIYKEYSKGSQVGHWKGWIENANGAVVSPNEQITPVLKEYEEATKTN